MRIDRAGKTALVTGSTEGIGFGIAQELARAGATVIVNGRTQAKVDAAVEKLDGSARGVTAGYVSAICGASVVRDAGHGGQSIRFGAAVDF